MPIARPCQFPIKPVYLQMITPPHQLVISALEIEMKRRCHLKTTQKLTVVSPNKGKNNQFAMRVRLFDPEKPKLM